MKVRNNQQGLALLVLLFFLALFVTGYLVHYLNSAELKRLRDQQTMAALAEAKAALIGWSIARGSTVNARPGELPCPDNDAPATAGYGNEDASCVSGKIGRLPWKTLGVDEIKDGYGEPLWYAIDGAFRKRVSNNQPINSDTRATMQVYAADGVTKITTDGNEAAFIVFSVGPPINGEGRSSANIALCASTGTNILENRCSSNYLETTNGKNNAMNSGPYIAGNKSDTFNDQLIYVTASELMVDIEKRVGKEAQSLLQDYKNVHGYYPSPAKYNSAGCLDVGSTGYFTDCQSDSTICRGRFPDNASNGLAPPNDTPNWTGSNALPLWFSYNLWGQVIYYSVGDSSLKTPAGCAPQLTLDAANVKGLFFTPNSPLGIVVRNSPTQSTGLNRYLEDFENQDGWYVGANDIYVTPISSKDRVFVLP